MHRRRNGLDLFPEPIDLNQGSAQNNNDNVDGTNPVQTRPPNSAPGFTRWDRGESSSSGLSLQGDESCNEKNAKSRFGWPPSASCNPGSGSNPDSENGFFEPFNATGGTQGSLTHSSNRGSLNISHQSHGHAGESDGSLRNVLGAPHSIKSTDHETEQIELPNFCPSSSNLSNSNYLLEHNDSWGSSCKRKAVEGTNNISASSSSNQLAAAGMNLMQHHGSICYNTPGNLTITSSPLNPSSSNHSEIPNPGLNFSTRFNLARSEQVSEDPPVRRLGFSSIPQNLSRPITRTSNSSDLRSTATLRMDPTSQAHLSTRVNDSRRTGLSSSSPWNGFLGPQSGSSSSSYAFNEANNNNTRSSRRHDIHYPREVSVSEARNSVPPEQIDWSFEPEASSSSSSRNFSHGSSSSNIRAPSSGWLPRHYYHQTPQNHHRRFSEAAPWVQYPPRVESESGNNNNSRRSHYGLIPSPSEAGSSSRGQGQSDRGSGMSGDDVSGWHALTDIEERHRLIRRALDAMQRGVRLQAEDYMMIDPFIDEFAELHDRHRDMRLDVDNMSYEELLALGEDIGNVSTGLREEKITLIMKQKKHDSTGTSQNMEPCCICQEDYALGDCIGILDCMHEFHASCIKQWLTQKNLCPICKMTALETSGKQQNRLPT